MWTGALICIAHLLSDKHNYVFKRKSLITVSCNTNNLKLKYCTEIHEHVLSIKKKKNNAQMLTNKQYLYAPQVCTKRQLGNQQTYESYNKGNTILIKVYKELQQRKHNINQGM